tara:strand:+ start:1750 stop:3669 length:1920 start_codon:yes stop_codon:yes gene_type:complete
MARIIFLLLTAVFLLAAPVTAHAKNIDRLIQLIDYVGIDYQEAISNSEIINASEYAEMLEFSATIEMSASKLTASPAAASIQIQANQLKKLIGEKASTDQVMMLTSLMRSTIIKSYDLAVTPDREPDLQRGKILYKESCAACHGQEGSGNGPLAEGLEPRPTNFRDLSRYSQRSLYGLFNTITYGVEGTAMGDFSTLTNTDRWDLTAYLGQIAVQEETVRKGKEVWQQLKHKTGPVNIRSFTTLSPNEAAKEWENGYELMTYLRRSPEGLFSKDETPIMFAQNMTKASYKAYKNGQRKQAYELALTAYLEGFELIEANLAAVDSALMKTSEKAMFKYRNSLQKDTPLQTVSENYETLQSLLQKAQTRLEEKGSLTPLAAFIAGFVILLREGLEALLVVLALSAFLMKTDRRDAMPYLHIGWISALSTGAATWFVSDRILQISGATREVTEGIAALAAAIMLLFVGYWLHNKTSAAGWQRFIQGSVKAALNRRTLWGLAVLSFISVYREVFETILFYQALWAQTASHSGNSVIMGFLAAIFVLLVVTWLVVKYSVRLPLRQFFGGTSALLLILSFIFAGKGIAALQEAGKISQTFMQFPSIEWLGVFPTLEGLALQTTILIIAFLVYIRNRNGQSGAHSA